MYKNKRLCLDNGGIFCNHFWSLFAYFSDVTFLIKMSQKCIKKEIEEIDNKKKYLKQLKKDQKTRIENLQKIDV